MTTLGSPPAAERWGQYPTRSATGYTHLCICPICGRLSLRDPDGRSQRAEAPRIDLGEEAAHLATFRATRSRLPRVQCRVCGVKTRIFSRLEEYLDPDTDALVGLVARFEQFGGRKVCFELQRAGASENALLAPIGNPSAVKSLLCWLITHPLPAVGKIEPQPSGDLFEGVIRIDQQAQAPVFEPDAVRMQYFEGLFELQPHPLWNEPLQLVVVVSEEIGSDATVASVFARVRNVVPELLRRHLAAGARDPD